MNVDTIVSDVKGRVEPIVTKGQEVLTVSFDTLKQANGIVVDGVQSLVKTQVEAGKDLFGAVQTSFEKAKTDGIKAVATSPVEYLPEGREVVVAAYNDSVAIVTKSSEELVKVVKQGYENVSAKLSGKTTVSAEVSAAKKTVKKTVKKAGAAAKKATA
jgi:hypothetical protein